MDKIKSPITSSFNTIILKTYSKNHFIDLYKTSLNINVSRFFEGHEEIFYMKCLDTNYNFFYPEQILGDDLFYEELQKFDWYYSKEKWEFKEALKHVKSSDKILEIGAGNGAFLNYLKIEKSNIDILEFNQKAINALREKGYQVHDKTIETFSKGKQNYYDVIVTFQVLEHIFDVKSFLDATLHTLKPNGKLIISVPNDKAWIISLDPNLALNYPPHHMGHLNSNTFKKLQKYFPIQLDKVMLEPLDQNQYDRYYKVFAMYMIRKMGSIGKFLDRMIYPISTKLVSIFSKRLKGQSMVVIFKKVE